MQWCYLHQSSCGSSSVCECDISTTDEVRIMGVATQFLFVVVIVAWPVNECLGFVLRMTEGSVVEREDEDGYEEDEENRASEYTHEHERWVRNFLYGSGCTFIDVWRKRNKLRVY